MIFSFSIILLVLSDDPSNAFVSIEKYDRPNKPINSQNPNIIYDFDKDDQQSNNKIHKSLSSIDHIKNTEDQGEYMRESDDIEEKEINDKIDKQFFDNLERSVEEQIQKEMKEVFENELSKNKLKMDSSSEEEDDANGFWSKVKRVAKKAARAVVRVARKVVRKTKKVVKKTKKVVQKATGGGKRPATPRPRVPTKKPIPSPKIHPTPSPRQTNFPQRTQFPLQTPEATPKRCPACPMYIPCPDCPLCPKCPTCHTPYPCPACPVCPSPCPKCPSCKKCKSGEKHNTNDDFSPKKILFFPLK
ncbi:hypothetical protein TRFO_42641 [Tritrichomonas foetus]|uniref:Uncharacterized protein n=1 Tax=Tritrichomonas foetus TaxID=1144522 RepID=A0A1J4KVP2_9EUKA|nr:hypothetical protein TRFO_42641 [Tritrichomonas foetus]|eukprot:OHT15218.1 hypothetical protein TRFO_42641 [Tritrichomonas foetus]